MPMVIPALAEDYNFVDLASRLDGLMLTGGRANVEPHHYNGPPFPEDEVRDPPRDNTVLPLVRECVAQGVPDHGLPVGQPLGPGRAYVVLAEDLDHGRARDPRHHRQRHRNQQRY